MEALAARPLVRSRAPAIRGYLSWSARFVFSKPLLHTGNTRVKTNVKNQVAEIRKSRGIGASELSRRVNVSRQTIYAIEAGTYVPNTEVALRLAQELEVTVDELFTLEKDGQKAPESFAAEVLSGSPA